MKSSSLFVSIFAAGLALGALALNTTAIAAEPPADKHADQSKDGKGKDGKKDHAVKDEKKADKKDEKKAEKKADAGAMAKVGETAPNFKLTDSDGKSVELAEVGKGKIVFIHWFNAECPYIVKQYSKCATIPNLVKDYAGKDVVFLAVNSGGPGKQGGGKALSATAKADWKMNFPILIDEDGKVGRTYGAKQTPDCYVIGKDGKLAYIGGIDNDNSADKAGDKNYVKMAIDELLAGKEVTTKKAKSYGCAVKYAAK